MSIKPMRMTYGFIIRTAMIAGRWSGPGLPNAEELVELTGKLPDIFPEKATIEQAQYALDHFGELVPGAEEKQ